MNKLDYKREYKNLYMPDRKPVVIDVPEIPFLMVDGKGDPNTSPDYRAALDSLYGLSYSIKMSKMNGSAPQGYFEYVVPPLEGLWWLPCNCFDGAAPTDKQELCWTSMIRQPEFVTQEVFQQAKETLAKKKPGLDLSPVRLDIYKEGRCVQMMHVGSYDDEPKTIKAMDVFLTENGYVTDIGAARKHHEIYLSDPRRTRPEKLKTVIRHPIKREGE